MPTTLKVFLAHGKGVDGPELAALLSECAAAVKLDHPDLDIVVTSGFTDWQTRLSACGGWEGWQRSVAQETDPFGAPLFDLIVIPFVKGGLVGKATGKIAALAEEVGKPIRALANGRLHTIKDIQVESHGFNPTYRMAI